MLLVVAAGSVLLGTLYPLFIDALGLGKLSVGPPYFNAVFVPIMVPLLFLMGVGPLARWKQLDAARHGAAAAPAAAARARRRRVLLPLLHGPLVAAGGARACCSRSGSSPRTRRSRLRERLQARGMPPLSY